MLISIFVNIMSSGEFEVCDKGEQLVTGAFDLKAGDQLPEHVKIDEPIKRDDKDVLKKICKKDLVKDMSLHGYHYGPEFQLLDAFSLVENISFGKITWNGNWVTFLDGMLQSTLVDIMERNLYLPKRIHELYIDPQVLAQAGAENGGKLDIVNHFSGSNISVKGVTMTGLTTDQAQKSKLKHAPPILLEACFIPFLEDGGDAALSDPDYIERFLQVKS